MIRKKPLQSICRGLAVTSQQLSSQLLRAQKENICKKKDESHFGSAKAVLKAVVTDNIFYFWTALNLKELHNPLPPPPPPQKNYLITWNFRETLVSRFWGSHISRHLNFAIFHKFCILTDFNFALFSETHLEIPVEATVRMEASTKNVKAINQRVEQHYKEPVNGQFEDCTKEELPGMETESSSDEENQNINT